MKGKEKYGIERKIFGKCTEYLCPENTQVRYIGAASDLYVDFPARLWDCQDHGCEDGCI